MKTTDLKIWLLRKGIRQVDIAKDLNIGRQAVWNVLHGRAKSKRVINWLISHECPYEYFEENQVLPCEKIRTCTSDNQQTERKK